MFASRNNRKNVLVLAAHPDDETLGCGATIAKLSTMGFKIQLITFTDGVGARRNQEAPRTEVLGEVCSSLGINNFICGSFPDNMMDTVGLLKIIKFIERNIADDPHYIFTHFDKCLNIDHRIVFEATATVFRVSNATIFSYYVPSSTDFNLLGNFDGNFYIDVSKFHQIKTQCLFKYYNKELRETRSISRITQLMKLWGEEVGVHFAEKFKLIKGFIS